METLREPERLRETDLFPGRIIGELRSVDIHVLEVELREASFLGQGDAGLAQGEVEVDAGIVYLILGSQFPYAVDGPGVVSGMFDVGYPAGCEESQAGDKRRK